MENLFWVKNLLQKLPSTTPLGEAISTIKNKYIIGIIFIGISLKRIVPIEFIIKIEKKVDIKKIKYCKILYNKFELNIYAFQNEFKELSNNVKL